MTISVEEADDPSGQGKCIALSATGQIASSLGPEQHPSTGLEIPPISVGETGTVTFLIQVSGTPVFDVRCGLASFPPNAATVRQEFRMYRSANSGHQNVLLFTHAGEGEETEPVRFFDFEPGLWYRVWLVSNNQDATCKIQILELGSTDSPEQFDTLNLTTNAGDEPLGFLGFVFDMDTASEGGEIFLKDAFWSEGENLTVPES